MHIPDFVTIAAITVFLSISGTYVIKHLHIKQLTSVIKNPFKNNLHVVIRFLVAETVQPVKMVIGAEIFNTEENPPKTCYPPPLTCCIA